MHPYHRSCVIADVYGTQPVRLRPHGEGGAAGDYLEVLARPIITAGDWVVSFDIYPVPALADFVVPHSFGYFKEEGESAVFFYVSRWYRLRFTTKPQIGHIGTSWEAAAVHGNGGAFLALARG